MAQKNNSSNVGVILGIIVFILVVALLSNSVWHFIVICLLAYGVYRWLSKKNLASSSMKNQAATSAPLTTPKQQEDIAKLQAELARMEAWAADSAKRQAQAKKTSKNQDKQARQATQQVASVSLTIEEPEFSVQISPITTTHYKITPPPPEFSPPPAVKVSRTQSDGWIAPGQDTTLYGYQIRGGMLYVVADLKSGYGAPEAHAIDIACTIDRNAHYAEKHTSYWPTYREISPQARGAYINWLADGRNAPEADIGYVFLYFYGLERRLLIDIINNPAYRNEVPILQTELRRLRAIYGNTSSSFERYCSALLDFTEAFDVGTQRYTQAAPESTLRYALSSHVRIALGQAARDGVPIPDHLALAWAEQAPDINRRTAVTRCAAQFKQLFIAQYRQLYGSGLKINPNKTKLCLSYHAGAFGIGGEIKLKTDLPDLSVLTAPLKKLQEIVDACDLALTPYSRYINKNADASERGLFLLPLAIWPAPKQEAWQQLVVGVQQAMQVSSMQALAAQLGHQGELSKDMMAALAANLKKENIQFEPDVFASAKPPKLDDKFTLFVNHAPSFVEVATPAYHAAYHAALVTLELAAAVAHADGDFSADELQLLQTHIASWQHLHTAQRQRLHARLLLLREKPITLASLKKKIEPLDAAARETIANFAATMVHADGDVSPDEVKLLEKIFTLLGLERSQVYSRIHASSVQAAFSPALGQSPAAAVPSSPVFALDHQKIAALEQESEKVTALLANIFNDEAMPVSDVASPALVADDVNEVGIEEPVAIAQTNVLGLDQSHSHFLRILISRKVWQRAELTDLAQDLDMMLDGALEHINDAAFDAFDLALTEGDDPIEINAELLEKISL